MTRRELAEGITRMYIEMGRWSTERHSEAEYVRRLLKGVGAMKPQSKAELQAWHDRLAADMGR